MRAILIGAALCAATFMALPAQAHALNDGVGAGKNPAVQIEVGKAREDDGPVRSAMRRIEPITTGSGAIGTAVSNPTKECEVTTVRSPQPNGTTIIRKLRKCS